MTEYPAPPLTPSVPDDARFDSTAGAVPVSPYSSGATPDTDTGSDTKDVAKGQAAQVGQGAAEAGQHVAGVAKEQTAQVAREAGQQAKDLAVQAHGQLKEQAGAQQQRLVGGLRSVSTELTNLVDGKTDQPGVVSDLARQAAERTHSVAGWLEGREPSDVLSEISSFARRRPGAFLAIAGGVGFLAGRLTRGLQANASDSSSSSSTAGTGSSTATYSTGYSTDSQPVSPYADVPPVALPPVAGFGDATIDVPLSPQASPEAGYLGENR